MSELDNIVAVYKAIDEIAMEDPTAVERVATVVGPYRKAGRTGWTDTEAGRLLVDGVPSLDEALADMAETEPQGRLRSRRLLAIAALIRAQPARFGEGGSDVEAVANALVPLMPPDAPDLDDLGGRSSQLVTLLAGSDGGPTFGDLDAWPAMLEEAFDRSLLDARTAEQTTPPCKADVITVRVEGQADPALVVKTAFTRPGKTLADLDTFLDPVNWPDCCELWKQMTRLNPNEAPPCYLEVVGLDKGRFELRARLTFVRSTQVGGATLEYRLCVHPAHLEQDPEPRIIVDEGVIEAREVGGSLRVETSKRLIIGHPFDVSWMEMFVCVLGYASVGEDMMFSCT